MTRLSGAENAVESPVESRGTLRTVEDLRGPAGRLEALLNYPTERAPNAPPVLLCHPHPLFGGTLHNKVVYHAMKTFTGLGLPVLRFNFRGAGCSEGIHDHGRGEQEDTRAALDRLLAEFGVPALAAGFSFGAYMALRTGSSDPRVSALVSLGTPLQAADRQYDYAFLRDCRKPKLFLSGENDPFGPKVELSAMLASVPEPKETAWIPGADHFFVCKLPMMQDALRGWCETTLARDKREVAG